MTNILKNKVNNIDLKVIHIENCNLDEKGLKQVIVNCKKMTNLKEFSLIRMPFVK